MGTVLYLVLHVQQMQLSNQFPLPRVHWSEPHSLFETSCAQAFSAVSQKQRKNRAIDIRLVSMLCVVNSSWNIFITFFPRTGFLLTSVKLCISLAEQSYDEHPKFNVPKTGKSGFARLGSLFMKPQIHISIDHFIEHRHSQKQMKEVYQNLNWLNVELLISTA